jgi:hypothetical protein
VSDLLVMGLGGFLTGALAAEWYHVRPPAGGVRLASLDVRSVDDHLPERTRSKVRAAAVLPAMLAVIFVLVHPALAGNVAVVMFAVIVLVALALVEVVQRHVVARPRPLLTADMGAADDALRATAVHSLSAALAALAMLATAWNLNALAFTTHDAGRALLALAAIASYAAAIGMTIRARRIVRPARTDQTASASR